MQSLGFGVPLPSRPPGFCSGVQPVSTQPISMQYGLRGVLFAGTCPSWHNVGRALIGLLRVAPSRRQHIRFSTHGCREPGLR